MGTWEAGCPIWAAEMAAEGLEEAGTVGRTKVEGL